MFRARIWLAAAGLLAAGPLAAQTLEQRFEHPTQSAKPRVWWHWIDGNVTREGITRDLEWMQRIGLGGFQMFDVGRGYPAFVQPPVEFMSPQWKALVRHAASEADRLGLEMTLASSAGWSETGGPKVAPESAMKKLVWSETRVHGGRHFGGVLPVPPSANGPFQDLAPKPDFQLDGEPKPGPPRPSARWYADTRVIAYRLPSAVEEPSHVRASASAGKPEAALLRDGRFDRAFVMPTAPQGQPNWVQFDFGRAVTIRSLRLGIEWPEKKASPMPEGSVEASDDGRTFRTVASLPPPVSASGLPVYTLALPETNARYFRLSVKPGSGFLFPGLPVRQISEFRFTEIDFSDEARPNRFEAKAAFSVARDYDALATAPMRPDAAIAPDGVIDLTNRLQPDGRLDWDAPPGEWSVIRFGASLTGKTNAPATAAGTGFEVDKYSAGEVRRYLDQYYGEVLSALGDLSGARGLRAILTDSFEAGPSNWTPALLDEFRARRGYDPTPYLPALADHIVGSAEITDKFLWDFRRTLADLLAESHYQTVADYAKAHGLQYYGEAMGVDWPTTGDGLQDKRYPTVPMAEFWQVAPDKPSGGNHIADVREAASAAHVYGQNIVATESFTQFPLPGIPAPYTTTPWLLKPLADRFMAMGVNRFVIHTAVHQPLEKAPGFTLSIFGQYFSRFETWGEHAKAWIDYLSRASELLQQGRYAADIAYFYGEGAAVSVPDGAKTDPEIPPGYGFDFVGRDMLLADFRVDDGRLLAPSGVAYKLLVLPATTTRLSLPLARKLRELVAAGAVLVGPKPQGAAGLGGTDAEVQAVADELWADLDGKTKTARAFGKGRVYWSARLEEVLAAEKLTPDFRFEGQGADQIVAIHRKLADGELYFVANQNGAPVELTADLRVSGREAELWHPDDGRIEDASFRQQDGRTLVPLSLAAYDSVFVVLRKPTHRRAHKLREKVTTALSGVEGGWDVSFQPDRGAPATAHFDKLSSWTESPDAGVRYFSGTATYRKTIEVPKAWLRGKAHLLLDLGEVHETAKVTINGRLAGIAWKPPYRVEVSGLLKPGTNELEIEVANLWANRIIGDRQPGAPRQYAFSTFELWAPHLVKLPFTQDTPLLRSGLLGPVQILAEKN